MGEAVTLQPPENRAPVIASECRTVFIFVRAVGAVLFAVTKNTITRLRSIGAHKAGAIDFVGSVIAVNVGITSEIPKNLFTAAAPEGFTISLVGTV